MSPRLDLRKLDTAALSDWLKAQGQPSFRAKQIQEWLWKKSCRDIEAMHNLPKDLRQALLQAFELRPLSLDMHQVSQDGTIKFRFKLHDGHLIESVLIPVPEQDRYTVCISSQVGCSLTCKFCATGKMKRLRNLDAAEIYDQVVLVQETCLATYQKPLTNIVYMGMGEPLLNYTEVLRSVELISSPQGLGMSPRRITISTAGIAKMIRRLADDQVRCNLALSLHAANDVKRNEIMPINEQNNLEILMEALQYFKQKTKDNKLTFEYLALKNFNESLDDAKQLLKYCRQLYGVKVNIIEYNPIDGESFERADAKQIDAFAAYLAKYDVAVTVRRSRGKDIDAACGQLANKG